jgi:sporulation protein YlmC with PRC-barrel domain
MPTNVLKDLMDFRLSCTLVAAILLAPLSAFFSVHAQQEGTKVGPAQRWEAAGPMQQLPARFGQEGFNAAELLGAPVRDDWGRRVGDVEDIIVGRTGKIEKLVTEVGGFLEAGDQHIGVLWDDVQVGPEVRWVQVPLVELEDDLYSLGGRTPHGEDVVTPGAAWRVKDLIGEFTSIEGEERSVLVTDVAFGRDAEVLAVVVRRGDDYVGPGWERVMPYVGSRRGRFAYDLPAPSAPPRFEYIALEKLSRFADERNERRPGNDGGKR